jgi:exosortase C (VPDSG-CTERM-specific)
MFEKPINRFLLVAVALGIAFSFSLYRLALYAAGSDLYSYILLVPIIAVYLVWLKRRELTADMNKGEAMFRRPIADTFCAAVLLFGGIVALAFYWAFKAKGMLLSRDDSLSLTTFSFVCLLVGGGICFFGTNVMKRVAFPVLFLFFTVPFPTFFTDWFEAFLQRASADAASSLFAMSSSTVYRDGLMFRLPGLSIEVARECSGIHSTLVLFITGLLAGYLFLRSWWKRSLLALIVVPLGILRNGFRIFTLGYLSVHVNPDIIDSPLHHRGGPIFFVLSLVPFCVLLLWLRRSERRTTKDSGLCTGEGVHTREAGTQRP